MASKYGRNAFTVQESVNMGAFNDYYVLEKTLTTDYQTIFDSSVAGQPAKQVVLTNSGAAVIDTTDVISVVLNDEDDTDATKTILIGGGHLPFTIDGMLITKVEVKNSEVDANEELACIAFM